jgi:hypothetical protein
VFGLIPHPYIILRNHNNLPFIAGNEDFYPKPRTSAASETVSFGRRYNSPDYRMSPAVAKMLINNRHGETAGVQINPFLYISDR